MTILRESTLEYPSEARLMDRFAQARYSRPHFTPVQGGWSVCCAPWFELCGRGRTRLEALQHLAQKLAVTP
jgi:hypothetical protein